MKNNLRTSAAFRFLEGRHGLESYLEHALETWCKDTCDEGSPFMRSESGGDAAVIHLFKVVAKGAGAIKLLRKLKKMRARINYMIESEENT